MALHHICMQYPCDITLLLSIVKLYSLLSRSTFHTIFARYNICPLIHNVNISIGIIDIIKLNVSTTFVPHITLKCLCKLCIFIVCSKSNKSLSNKYLFTILISILQFNANSYSSFVFCRIILILYKHIDIDYTDVVRNS